MDLDRILQVRWLPYLNTSTGTAIRNP